MRYLLTLTLITALSTTLVAAKAPNIVEAAIDNPDFSTLVAALKAADLVDTVKGNTFTVFAPTNEAFDQLPEGTLEELLKPENKDRLAAILKYHVIPGAGYELSALLERKEWNTAQGDPLDVRFEKGRIRVNDAALQASGIACANGVIHVIDSVMLPPEKAPANLVETARAAGNFKTLLAAVKAAGLAEVLAGEGPFTVFAPTDAAFAKIPEKTLNELLKPESKDRLVDLLKYHVVAGKARAGDALNAGGATALNGKAIPVAYQDGALRSQWAKVLEVDIESGNGIIHVIDSVMLPPGKKAVRHSTARQHIEAIVHAIDQGVPLYNHGDPEACSNVYMATSHTLLKDQQLPGPARASLQHATSRAQQSHCANTRAWMLRHGLDRAYVALKHAMRDDERSN